MSRYVLARGADRSLRRYLYHVWADDPVAASHEAARIHAALERFAGSFVDGVQVALAGWQRPLRRHYIHPFHVYYERRVGELLVVRLHHHARKPIA